MADMAAPVGKLPREALPLERGRDMKWRPTPLASGSAALHLAAVAAVVVRPHVWPWALGAVALDHVLLAAVGLWPRSTLLGANWTRLPQAAAIGSVAITIDDGPDPDITPRVLALLDEHNAKATF